MRSADGSAVKGASELPRKLLEQSRQDHEALSAGYNSDVGGEVKDLSRGTGCFASLWQVRALCTKNIIKQLTILRGTGICVQ